MKYKHIQIYQLLGEKFCNVLNTSVMYKYKNKASKFVVHLTILM